MTRMSDDRARLAKWPFYVADLLLSAVVVFVLYRLGKFEGTAEILIVTVCVAAAAVAAWISVLPWLKEHDAMVHLNDSSNLKSSVEQIKGVEKVADLIRQSNTQWQGVQEASARTVASAHEITEKMKLEADEFMKFIAQAHDQERAGLRLEVEKLRRMEGDWIKVAVQMLDHVFALNRAAERSAQAGLIKQINQFQGACRDVARRMGLTTFVPATGDIFDQRAHQLTNPQLTAQEGDRIGDVLATGFTYQGQLLRRSLVVLENSAPPVEPAAPEESAREIPMFADAPENTPAPEEQPAIIPESPAPSESAGAAVDGSTLSSEDQLASTEVFEEVQPSEEELRDAERAEMRPAMEGEPEDPVTRGARTTKRTGQEELPF